MLDNNQQAFFLLLQAGLWGNSVQLRCFDEIDLGEVYRIASEQSVVGVIAFGLERVDDIKVPKPVALAFASSTIQLESRNKAMNSFISQLVSDLRDKGINALLVKGQGIAQCYNKPLWRACGDVDLLLNAEDYVKAKEYLTPKAVSVEQEHPASKHLGMMVDSFLVELHGTLRSRLSNRVDELIDNVQKDTFANSKYRVWKDGDTDVLIPSPDNDVIFLFTHILHHYFLEGVGLRQICDWCKFLLKFKDSLDVSLLEQRLRSTGLMSEWYSFAALAVKWLGMPENAMPLYSKDARWRRKAGLIIKHIMKTGNFGHNRKPLSSKFYLTRKLKSARRKAGDFASHTIVFPLDSIRFFFHFLKDGIVTASKGELFLTIK